MNPIRITLTVLASCLFLAVNQAHAVVIDFEDFEDDTVNYVLVKADDVTPQDQFIENDAADEYAYFGRFLGDGGFIPDFGTTYNPNTGNGNGFFAANNTDELAIGTANRFTTAFMDFEDIDISGFTNLTFSGAFAESSADDAAENWVAGTELQVLARIDSDDVSDYVQIFGLEAGVGGEPVVASGPDAGTEITDTFQSFMASITGTGNLLDLRVAFMNFDSDYRDIGLDNITVEGQAIPEPTSFALLGALAAFGGGYRLRRRRQTAEDVV